jgi:carbonic anhydrase
MSLIEHAIAANRKTAEHHDPSLANKPAPRVAILTCMDPRLNQLLEWLDIKPADADVIRNVGTSERQQRKMLCGLSCFRFTFWACERS